MITMNKREENLIRQIEGRCHHFNGMQNECCKAGVKYKDLTGEGLGSALKLPCTSSISFSKRRDELGIKISECSKLSRVTREEAEKEVQDIIKDGDRMMKICSAAHADAEAKGLKKGNGGRSTMLCPANCGGTLAYSVATYNGHMHAQCSTENCASWME
jgi:hypothetical protein